MTTQTQLRSNVEAERLADALERQFPTGTAQGHLDGEAAAELRRLVSFNQQLMDEVARLQKREWVGLTLTDREALRDQFEGWNYPAVLVDAIADKLKEKNERKEKNT